LYFALFGMIVSGTCRRLGQMVALLSAPFLWVSLEYIRSHIGFLSLPWALLGHSQYQYPVIIQFAALTGSYGVSFLAMMANSAITALILCSAPMLRSGRREGIRSSLGKSSFALSLATLVLVGIATIYGTVILRYSKTEQNLRLSVLQGNIGQEMKHNPKKHAESIMQKYTDLTRLASKESPVLIVWPEAATPVFVLKDLVLLNKITSLIKEARVHFLIGSSEYPKFASEDIKPEDFGNTALFFSPEAKVLGQYLKIQLVPFGEYVPYDRIVPWPQWIVPEGKKSYEIPGKDRTIFTLGGAKFGVLICWEIVFSDLFRKFVRDGAGLMINITNEGWFGDSAAPHQMVAISVFRSVENRVSLVRAANTGVSCFIDPNGRIIGRVRKNAKDTFVDGCLTGEIPILNHKTFYTMYGDIFAYLCIGMTILVLGVVFATARNRG
jgi:apolipoprotein N-acyltransferase